MKPEEYRLKIADLKPDEIPMSRMAEYLADFASLLGHRDSVHFVALDEGSTEIVAEVEYRDAPKVRDRLRTAKQDRVTDEIGKAYQRLDRRLRSDNTSAELLGAGRKVVEFPGIRVAADFQFGPFNEQGSITGIPIRIGGENDPVPAHLRDIDGTVYHCLARIETAQRLAKHMFVTPVRAEGVGRWRREASGTWVMDKFTIRDFTEVRDEKITEAVGRMRSHGNPWDAEDPVGELQRLRSG